MRLIVCGGAGYIGSHLVKHLLRAGHEVAVLDNLSTGHREAVGSATLIEADLLDAAAVNAALAEFVPDAVLHFAALSIVGDSVRQPYAYYRNNVGGTLNLLAAMQAAGVRKLIFSSTAAVYGNPEAEVIDEAHPTRPINPYGASKLAVEHLLEHAFRAHELRSVALRYFNAAGADADGELGESHHPETHLIPSLLRAARDGAPALKLFGTDYPTRDGTCARDYIHVEDLADGHARALDYLAVNAGAFRFNLGTGHGCTVAEMIAAAERVTGRAIPAEHAARRAGDPPTLVASRALAQRELGWEPRHSSINTILGSAWRWHQNPRF